MTQTRKDSEIPWLSVLAYAGPFALFLIGIAAAQGFGSLWKDSENLLLRTPAYWVFPLQTAACAALLLFFWRYYSFGSQRAVPLGIGVGVLVFILWISPQAFFGQPARTDGFNPEPLASSPLLYWTTIAARFLRLAVVVPLVEEIFWRGFLQRFLIKEQFTTVPFGTYTHLSFWAVAVAFTFEHSQPDWPAAFITGALYGWVAVRTKSLLACVVAHGVTNLLLGGYIVLTRQWGFW
jgi:CAAX prenyl protease-like protein